MSDHPTPHDETAAELASAYVDGQLTPAERAEVERSADLRALAATFQEVRIAVGDVPPASADARDLAVAAALAEFDLHAAVSPAAPAPPSNVVALGRTRLSRVLSAAAAVALLGVVGLVAVNALGDSSSKSSSVVPAAGGVSPDAAPTASPGSKSERPVPTIGSIGGAASAPVQVDSPAALLTVTDQYAGTDTGMVTPGVSDTAVGTATAGGTSRPSDATVPTNQPEAATTSAPSISVAAPASGGGAGGGGAGGIRPTLHCNLSRTQLVIAPIQYRGVSAYAVRDTVTQVVQAIDVTCHVLATATP